jgi:hypothetical protein
MEEFSHRTTVEPTALGWLYAANRELSLARHTNAKKATEHRSNAVWQIRKALSALESEAHARGAHKSASLEGR